MDGLFEARRSVDGGRIGREDKAAARHAMRARWPHTVMGVPCDLRLEVRHPDGRVEVVYDSASARERGARALMRALGALGLLRGGRP